MFSKNDIFLPLNSYGHIVAANSVEALEQEGRAEAPSADIVGQIGLSLWRP
jgi:hypothetical protein